MADNSLLIFNSKRRDIRAILQNTYVINPNLDECGMFMCKSNNDTTITLPQAIPGRVFRFMVGGVGGFIIVPIGNDRILFKNNLIDSLVVYYSGAYAELKCNTYGVWSVVEAVGDWTNQLNTFNETFDKTFD